MPTVKEIEAASQVIALVLHLDNTGAVLLSYPAEAVTKVLDSLTPQEDKSRGITLVEAVTVLEYSKAVNEVLAEAQRKLRRLKDEKHKLKQQHGITDSKPQ